MRLIFAVIFSIIFCLGQAQHWGAVLNSGISTILSGSQSFHTPGGDPLEFSPMVSGGLGILYGSECLKKYEWNLRAGIQRRGAIMKPYPDEYLPRYKTTYADVSVLFGRKLSADSLTHQFILTAGVTGSLLLDGWRLYDSGGDRITGEFSSWDLGAVINFSWQKKLKRGDAVRIGVEGTYGFRELFAGMLEANGMSGKNLFTGISLGYFLLKSR